MTNIELSQKSLYELRIIGRKIGVKSVSTLRKNELIQGILDISDGNKKPIFNNRGRKPYPKNATDPTFDEKKLYLVEQLLDKTKKEILDILKG